jgi:ABC-type nitrate/sulfonate/bicarbonate transport system ATPase subunit
MMRPQESGRTDDGTQRDAPEAVPVLPDTVPVLRVRAVSKRFVSGGGSPSSIDVLAGIDLDLGRGEFVSIVGPSGCGKSTLLNLISGLDTDYDGEIRLNGDSAMPRIGRVPYMHQRDLLMPWRTVLDNATISLEIRGAGKGRAREEALVHFDDFGLTQYATSYPSEISGGMRQRVALLRATLPGADLLLLDEPFGALDAITRSSMHTWLSQLLADSERAVLLVTHDVEEALLLSDRVHVLSSRPGRIVATLDVEFPRPREASIVTSPEFVELKVRLLHALSESSGVAV